MKKNNKFLILIFLGFIIPEGAIYKIDTQKIDSMNLYYILEIVENIPEIQTIVMDASDFGAVVNNNFSLLSSSLIIAYNGIPIPIFHDGTSWPENRIFQNSQIERIEILTNSDKYQICDQCDIVINIIPKRDQPQRCFYVKSYVGSEIGDPTLFSYILPSDSIPCNKEQIAAGEVHTGFSTEKICNTTGLSLIYMDRYSNRYEGYRSSNFGPINAHQSLHEQKTGFLSTVFNSNNTNTEFDINFSKFDVFRFHQLYKKYFYYDGYNFSIFSLLNYNKEKYKLSLKANFSFGKSDKLASLSVKEQKSILGYTIQPDLKINLNENISLNTNFHLFENNISKTNQADSNIFLDTVKTINPALQKTGGTISLNYKDIFSISVYHPIGSRVHFKINTNTAGMISTSISAKKIFFYNFDIWEHIGEILWEYNFINNSFIKTIFSLLSTREFSIQSHSSDSLNYKTLFTEYFTYQKGDRIFIPQVSITTEPFNTGRGVFYYSPFTYKASWNKKIIWHGLTIKGGISYNSVTYWSERNQPLTKKQSKEYNNYTKLPSYITGNISSSHTLFKDKVTLAINVWDIGKKHYETPSGNIAGPIISTSLKIIF